MNRPPAPGDTDRNPTTAHPHSGDGMIIGPSSSLFHPPPPTNSHSDPAFPNARGENKTHPQNARYDPISPLDTHTPINQKYKEDTDFDELIPPGTSRRTYPPNNPQPQSSDPFARQDFRNELQPPTHGFGGPQIGIQDYFTEGGGPHGLGFGNPVNETNSRYGVDGPGRAPGPQVTRDPFDRGSGPPRGGFGGSSEGGPFGGGGGGPFGGGGGGYFS